MKLWLLAILVSSGVVGCQVQMKTVPPTVIFPNHAPIAVILNGQPIPLEIFDADFRLLAINYSDVTEDHMQVIKRQLFDEVINRWLLAQEAEKLGIVLTPQEYRKKFSEIFKGVPAFFADQVKLQGIRLGIWRMEIYQEILIRKLVQEKINNRIQINQQQIQRYYWHHLKEFWKPSEIWCRHLWVKTPQTLHQALQKIAQGVSFSAVVKRFSIGRLQAQGGNWGWRPLSFFEPSFLKAMRKLKPGQVSRVVHDAWGYQVFQFLGRRTRRIEPLDKVKQIIYDKLKHREEFLRFRQWLKHLQHQSMVLVNPQMAEVLGVTVKGEPNEAAGNYFARHHIMYKPYAGSFHATQR